LPSSISPFSASEILAHETREMTAKEEKAELIYKDESYAIIGACFAVYKDKRCGFLEPVYPGESISLEAAANIAIPRSHARSGIQPGLPLLRQNHSRDQSGLPID
jgi:hypothetical protein